MVGRVRTACVRVAKLVMLAIALSAASAAPTGSSYPTPLVRISTASDGTGANHTSSSPAISGDCRFVAFESNANNLVTGDTGTGLDVFIHDVIAHETTLISMNMDGEFGDEESFYPSLSTDARYVAFHSSATDLVPDDTNEVSDVFVRDRLVGETIRVSISTQGEQADGASQIAAISANGRFVAFQSLATNLVVSDTNGLTDVFVHDQLSGITERVSVSSAGVQVSNWVGDPAISGDGRFITFRSADSLLVGNDSNNLSDVFTHDRLTGTTTRVSIGTSGVQFSGESFSSAGAISADGRHVVFALHSGGTPAIYVRDRVMQTTGPLSEFVSGTMVNIAGQRPTISPDGRYVTLERLGISGMYEAFVVDRSTGHAYRVSYGSDGSSPDDNSSRPVVCSGGSRVAFASWATNLAEGDDNGKEDVYLRSFFRIYLPDARRP
jgi:Tol biopolymer transport system component